ncbi:unnamed protein product [Linum tenue]|uniref:KIB1-4 beta-propeller domain-containing protein n=1 Tax=Linum tenue TaxID=586396 RepID=A0AAV0J248_9ROSI|nr:unnamed protein product [Linum tenue]
MTVKLYYGDNRDTDCSYKVRRVEGFQTGVKRLDLYKANFLEEKWERVETLPEDTAIFLGSRSDNAVSYKIPRRQDLVVGGGGVRGNTVYFTPPTNDGYLYAYDVGDRSISVSLPCSKANRPDYSEPHWIIPLGCSSSTDDPQPEFDISPDEIGSEQIILSTGNDDSSTDHDGRHWSYDIPSELLSDVQSRLFGADRCFFRLACKTWNSIFSSVVSTSSNVRFARNHSFPILVHKGLDGEVVSLFNPITSVTSILSLEASSLRGAVIRCSKHGWLLMSQGLGGDQHRLFFFNPFTEDRINLPMLSYDLEGITFSSSSPTSFDCLVICYTALWQQVVISFIYRGEHQWTQYEVMSDSSNFMSPFSNPIYHKGLLYFMGKNADLCIHDFEQKTTITIELPNRSCTSVQRSYLLECNGKLLSVLMGHMGKVLEVYALDQEAITWKELDNLEDNMLFVSAASALSATNSGEKISGLGNKVFLDRFKDKDGVFYSLATRKFHTFWSGYNNDDWCNTKEYINCAWIEPSFKTHTKDELQW